MKTHHKRFIGPYKIDYLFAAGSFGKVYHATKQKISYAIKQVIEPIRMQSKLRMQNQINTLQSISHPNVVKMYQVIRQNHYVYMVMQCCQGDLRQLMKKKKFSQDEALNILKQVVKGFKQIVNRGIVHRDVKPANILFSKGIYKIADFGLVKYISEQEQLLKTKVGTPYYMSPQILKNQQYTSKCDIWSLGIIFYELLFGNLPWYAPNQQILIKNIESNQFKIQKKINYKTENLLNKMLQIQQNQRISWVQLFQILQIQISEQQVKNEQGGHYEVFNRTTLQKLMAIQCNRISEISHWNKFDHIRLDQKKSVISHIIKLFKDQFQQICVNSIKI